MAEPFAKSAKELREWDQDVWRQTEAQVPGNASVFAQLTGIHYDLLAQAHERNARQKDSRFERALRLMAARCTHILRAMWVSVMTGYPAAYQPLMRTLYETSLTMYYLRLHPEDLGIWAKRDKSKAEQRRFWPSEMMKRLKSPDAERLIYRSMAEAAHPNPPALSRLGGYDPDSDTLEISVGRVLPENEARRLSADICLLGAISAYNTARTVKDALVDGLPNEEQLHEFLGQLTKLTDSLEKGPVQGTTVFDMLAKKVRR